MNIEEKTSNYKWAIKLIRQFSRDKTQVTEKEFFKERFNILASRKMKLLWNFILHKSEQPRTVKMSADKDAAKWNTSSLWDFRLVKDAAKWNTASLWDFRLVKDAAKWNTSSLWDFRLESCYGNWCYSSLGIREAIFLRSSNSLLSLSPKDSISHYRNRSLLIYFYYRSLHYRLTIENA